MSIDNQVARLDRELTKFKSHCASISNRRRLFESEELQVLEDAHNKVMAAVLNKVAGLAHRFYNFGDLTTARRLRDIAIADDDSFFAPAAAVNTLTTVH
jgi:hypothetical protein